MNSLSRSVIRSLPLLRLPSSAWTLSSSPGFLHTSAALDRARQVTRERKRKVYVANKKKKEERLRKNPPPLPKKVILMLKSKGLWGPPKPLRAVEDDLQFPTDNVYCAWDFCYPRYDFEKAIEGLMRHYHPDLLDRQDDPVYAKIEFDMRANKKERYMDDFEKMVPLIHSMDPNAPEKTICAFVPNDEEKEKALKAGAIYAGGEELLQEIIKGRIELADIDHFVCHVDMLVQMKSVAGLLREKTPKKNSGTVGTDVTRLVRTYISGIAVQVKKVPKALGVADEPDYGFCEVAFGVLNQEEQLMKENLDTILDTLLENKPNRSDGGFITRVILKLADGPAYAEFSIHHDAIHDEKWQRMRKEAQEIS